MTDFTYGLGGRLPLLAPHDLGGDASVLYDEILANVVPAATKAGFRSTDHDGHLIGPFNATLYSPKMCGSFLALQRTEGESTTLSKRVRQVVILSVGSIWKSGYELYAHTAAAEAVGLSLDQAGALATGQQAAELAPEEEIAQAFTRQLVSTHAISPEMYARAREAFGDRALVEMVTLIGCYLSVCALLNAFQVPVPDSTGTKEASND